MANELNEARRQEIRKQRHESRTSSTYKQFLKDLCSVGDMNEEDAERSAVSVLCALEQRIMRNEAEDMEAQLPFKLQQLLHRCEIHEGEVPKRFGREEFIQMVAADLKAEPEQAEAIARAVFTTVRNQISEGEAEDVAAQLPPDLADLWRRPS